jgi:hypothetical protein
MLPIAAPAIAPTEIEGEYCARREGLGVGTVEGLVVAEDRLDRAKDAEDRFEGTMVFGSFLQY